MLAIGLVIFTVVGMGFLIDWLIPAIPLPVAFALAAILSPTDPVAVSAIASKTPIPPRLMHILEGESLLNDASGLVCFRFAVLAALTGNFSFAKASWTFMLVAGGGALIGIVLTYTINLANRWLIRQTGEEPGVQIMISLLIPFATYLTANNAFASFFKTDFAEYVPAFEGWGQAGFVLQMSLNIAAVICLAGYASVSVSLGWKSSNLTSRGVVTTGLFKYVRHPAYVCKNAAWWLFAIGFAIHFAIAGKPFLWHLLALAVWTWVYYNRALTEELHMARTDPDYLTYMQKVPYRFIPKLI